MPADTRGILDPATMMQWVEFEREPPGTDLVDIVEWFWSVRWDFPDGMHLDQEVLSHPAGNVSIGTIDDRGVRLDPAEGRTFGVMTDVSVRHLHGTGWTVAARATVGGLGVLLDRPAAHATDRQMMLDEALPGLDGEATVRSVIAGTETQDRFEALRTALAEVVERRDPALRREAAEAVAIAAVAEHDRSVCRTEQLAAAAGTSVRTLQRLFSRHVGVSPAYLIRRWRIIEAAEAARVVIDGGDQWPGWAGVAAQLGYADQAHLTRDFRQHLGMSPSEYLARASGLAG